MLDSSFKKELSENTWNILPSRANLPCCWKEYFSQTGATRMESFSQRRYHRFHLRGIAILIRGNTYHAVYTKDLSRMGLGFYAPIQLLPKERIKIWLPQGKILDLTSARCFRLDTACYECGCLFHIDGNQ